MLALFENIDGTVPDRNFGDAIEGAAVAVYGTDGALIQLGKRAKVP